MVDKQLILDSVGPVQAVLDAHDGVVNVVDTFVNGELPAYMRSFIDNKLNG